MFPMSRVTMCSAARASAIPIEAICSRIKSFPCSRTTYPSGIPPPITSSKARTYVLTRFRLVMWPPGRMYARVVLSLFLRDVERTIFKYTRAAGPHIVGRCPGRGRRDGPRDWGARAPLLLAWVRAHQCALPPKRRVGSGVRRAVSPHAWDRPVHRRHGVLVVLPQLARD